MPGDLEAALKGRRVLVAEDEYMLADDQSSALRSAGAVVVGPTGTVRDTLDMISADDRIDAAILDINLRGEMIFPAADLLIARGVPFVFATGYDADAIPDRYGRIARCEKPVEMSKVARALSGSQRASG